LIRAHAEQILSQRLDIARLLFAARAEPIMKFFNVLPVRFALLKPEQLLESVLPSRVARNFAQLQIPLRVVATDFYAQEQVVLSQGALRTAIAASMALPAIFAPVVSEGRTLMDGGLVNPLPFDVIRAEADITVAIDVSGASTGPGKHPQPSAFSALMSSSQILQRSIVREKLKVDQPDIYIDVEVDEFHVLQFHRFRAVLEAAMPAKDKLRRQLLRVLASQTAETLPAAAAPEAEGGRKKRLPRLKRLAQGRRP
jgi:NTE family protein